LNYILRFSSLQITEIKNT